MNKIVLHGHLYGSTVLSKAKAVCVYKSVGGHTHTLTSAFSFLFFQNILQKWDQTICLSLQLAFFMDECLFWRNFDLSMSRSPSLYFIIAYYYLMHHYGCTIIYLTSFY